MKKIKKFLYDVRYYVDNSSEFWTGLIFALTAFFAASPVYSASLSDSKFATGLKKLLDDATTYLFVIVPIVTVLCVTYFLVRRGVSDEMDHRKWNSRIVGAIICGALAEGATALVNLLTGYFS